MPASVPRVGLPIFEHRYGGGHQALLAAGFGVAVTGVAVVDSFPDFAPANVLAIFALCVFSGCMLIRALRCPNVHLIVTETGVSLIEAAIVTRRRRLCAPAELLVSDIIETMVDDTKYFGIDVRIGDSEPVTIALSDERPRTAEIRGRLLAALKRPGATS